MRRILLVLLFILPAFSAFAMQFDAAGGTINPYASIRGDWFYGNITGDQTATTEYDRDDIPLTLQGNSRFGVNFKKDALAITVEFGTNGTDTNTRLAFADWDTGGGHLIFGQFASITGTSDVWDKRLGADLGAFAVGGLDAVRRMSLSYKTGPFQIALVSLGGDDNNRFAAAHAAGSIGKQQLPKIEVAVDLNQVAAKIPLKILGAFANFTVRDEALEEDYSATAYHLALYSAPKINDTLSIRATAFYSLNGGLYGQVKGFNYNPSNYQANLVPNVLDGDDLEGITSLGVAASLLVNAGIGTANFGLGYQTNDSDPWEDPRTAIGAFANYVIKPVAGIQITPEISYVLFDLAEDNTPSALQLGVHFRADI